MKIANLAVLLLSLVAAMAAVPASADTLYSNSGPYSYGNSAWTINGGQGIADSFTISQNGTVTGVDFVAWVVGGDTLTNVDWAISTSPFSGDIASGTGAAVSDVYSNSVYGYYSVDTDSFSVPSLSLAAGTYWLDLQNAVTADSGVAYWDWSGGSSQVAFSESGNFEGYIPNSNTFDITGSSGAPTVTPEPSSFLLLGSGLVGLAGMLKRKLMA